MVCLQETKMEELIVEVVREVWGDRYIDWEFLSARGSSRGSSGGILLC